LHQSRFPGRNLCYIEDSVFVAIAVAVVVVVLIVALVVSDDLSALDNHGVH
jgi:hypothetical protein